MLRNGFASSLVLASLAAAQSSFFAARTHEFRANQFTSFNQYWVRTDCDTSGSNWAVSWVSGQDPMVRLFDLDANPKTGDLVCDPTLNLGIQDESEVCVDKLTGNFLVAWSERHGYDGEQMGIFGRLFAPDGTALTAEFEINQIWQASQWRPLMVSPPSGGFLVTWSGDWDADCYFRILDSYGNFLSNDIPVNVYTNGGQADPTLAVAPDGTIFFVFVDYSGHGNAGSGLNVWGRSFDASGHPLQASEFPLTSSAFSDGDQREPRVSADGLGRFVAVWEDSLHDGSGWGVVGRRFDIAGAPIGTEFIVPSTTSGDQRGPRVAADASGRFTVVFEDYSSGSADIRARRFDANAAPYGPDFVVSEVTAGDQLRPSLAASPSGDDVLFTWEGPGVSTDAYARFFAAYQFPENYCTAKTNSQGCMPSLGFSGKPSLSGPDDFVITATHVLNNKNGIFFHGSHPAALPFEGGTLCVQPPLVRTAVTSSGGNPPPNDCSGAFTFLFTQAYMLSHGLAAGDLVYVQCWSRDPGFSAPNDVGLTDALRFEIRP